MATKSIQLYIYIDLDVKDYLLPPCEITWSLAFTVFSECLGSWTVTRKSKGQQTTAFGQKKVATNMGNGKNL